MTERTKDVIAKVVFVMALAAFVIYLVLHGGGAQ
jgi:uncharacterized membrane protein YtjA (UPF0391 family)